MHTWQLQDAKSHFSEVVERSLTEGPQLVTRRGQEAVVIMAAREYKRLTGNTPSLMSALLNAPRGESLVADRMADPVRDLAL